MSASVTLTFFRYTNGISIRVCPWIVQCIIIDLVFTVQPEGHTGMRQVFTSEHVRRCNIVQVRMLHRYFPNSTPFPSLGRMLRHFLLFFAGKVFAVLNLN